MDGIHWFAVSNWVQKRKPQWQRSFGISDKRIVFVPAAMAVEDPELLVVYCASAAGQVTVLHLEHHFVPSAWLKRNYPEHAGLIEVIEARAHLVIAAAFEQHDS